MGWLNDLVHHVAPEHPPRWWPGTSTRPVGRRPGHPPPLLVRGATARPLGQQAGILLGAGRDGYDPMTVTLEEGDVLLLYSDGLVERRDRPLDEGLATLARAAAGIGDPEDLITAVLDALDSTDSEDDTCLVALRVL